MSTPDVTLRALQLLEAQREFKKYNRIDSFFPETGPFRRELYAPHLEFFKAGAEHRCRLFLAGNRVGKSSAGAYEMTLHATGLYPSWWEGRRFNHPIQAWVAGDSFRTTRDILQTLLLGPTYDKGSGMIPRDLIIAVTSKPGLADSVEGVLIRHVSGSISELLLKSYNEGRESFQGTSRDVCWLDEECDLDIFTEVMMRTMTTQGLVYLTCTPLRGMSDVIRSFLQPEEGSDKVFFQCNWDQTPHLDEQSKKELLASIPEYQREARSKGVPQLGSGAIFPIPESDIVVPDFEIPDHWPRGFGLDVGWRKTAAVWGAKNPETGEMVLCSEHYAGNQQPVLHADAIKSRGLWVPGVCDPAANGRSQVDGTRLLELYRNCGLDLQPAMNAVEAGLYECWQLMSAGKLKVFRSLQNWLSEFRLYQRDEDGKVVKQNDHLMDATRYLIVSGRERMKAKPTRQTPKVEYTYPGQNSQRWMM